MVVPTGRLRSYTPCQSESVTKTPWASMQLSPIMISVAALIRTPGQIRQQSPIAISPPSPRADQTVSLTFLSGVAMTVL